MSHLREHFMTGSPAAFPVIGGVEGSLKLGTQSLWSCRSEPGPLACGSGPRLLAHPGLLRRPRLPSIQRDSVGWHVEGSGFSIQRSAFLPAQHRAHPWSFFMPGLEWKERVQENWCLASFGDCFSGCERPHANMQGCHPSRSEHWVVPPRCVCAPEWVRLRGLLRADLCFLAP